MDPVTVLEQFIQNFTQTWSGFSSFVEGFAEFGLSGIEEDIRLYGQAEASATTQVFAVLYVLAKMLPGTILVFLGVRHYLGTKKGAIVGILFQIASVGITSYILGVRATPTEQYNTFAYGPSQIISAFEGAKSAEGLSEVVITWVVVFGVFFLISYLMWYFVNFLLWFITLTFRREPLFSDSSAKGHALWMTLTWLFYLSITTAGSAFVNTIFVLGIIILNRGWQDRKKRKGPSKRKEGDKQLMMVQAEQAEQVQESSDDSGGEITWK